jgi:hypothetical protein
MKLKALSFFSKKLDVSDSSPRSPGGSLQSGTHPNAPVPESGRPGSTLVQDRFSSSFTPSPASHQSVMHNLHQVHTGNMSQGTAHFTEAISFAQDAANSFAHGRPLQGMVETSGVLLNTVGGLGMSFLQGLGSTSQGATPPELSGISDW